MRVSCAVVFEINMQSVGLSSNPSTLTHSYNIRSHTLYYIYKRVSNNKGVISMSYCPYKYKYELEKWLLGFTNKFNKSRVRKMSYRQLKWFYYNSHKI